MNFSSFISVHAHSMPDKTALTEVSHQKNETRHLTWSELEDAVNRVAAWLHFEGGIKKGDVVMHFQNNSINWLVSYFAVIRLGAVVMPLSFRFTSDELASASKIGDPKWMIYDDSLAETVHAAMDKMTGIEKFICIGTHRNERSIDFNELLNYNSKDIQIENVEDDHPLAMMFTSGTTGNPKAVVHTHSSMMAIAEGNKISYGIEPGDTYLIMIPLFHSGSLFFWTAYYISGASAVILKEFSKPEWIFKTISAYRCSDMVFVVPIGLMVLNAIENKIIDISAFDLSSWKRLIMGAQPVPHHVMKKFSETVPAKIYYSYGITEGGGAATMFCSGNDILEKPGSVGKPTFGVEMKLAGEDNEDINDVNAVGELLIKTKRNMKAYFNNPELTKEAFLGDFLRTGDMARRDAGGFYFLVDRKKDVIVCGGENLYPAEMESVLAKHPDIFDVAVIGYPDEKMVEIALAIVKLKDGKVSSEGEIIDYAKKNLPAYKCPRKVIFGEVTRNATGKIMKPLLRERYTGKKESITS